MASVMLPTGLSPSKTGRCENVPRDSASLASPIVCRMSIETRSREHIWPIGRLGFTDFLTSSVRHSAILLTEL